jgi:UPF0716 family protein affecting phage T7 exclusion
MKRKGMEIEMLGWWLIALIVLVLMLAGYMVLKSKGIDALEYVKNLFRFGS